MTGDGLWKEFERELDLEEHHARARRWVLTIWSVIGVLCAIALGLAAMGIYVVAHFIGQYW